MRSVALFLALVAGANAECPNACSGNGVCSAYDMCTCYRNFQGADCSERTCPFGIAHVDSPKGDLDMSADSLTTGTVISGSAVYPFGTEELFPSMMDSDDNVLSDTAHYYMECSNKGLCDRKEGTCECFDGYEGSACQRASCPEGCSGHGTCEHIETLAGDVTYELWDTSMTMGCKCDPGYSGADCSGKVCKYGVDPLYVDDEATARVSEQFFEIGGGALEAPADAVSGTYAIKFYDVFGEDYVTNPITINTVDQGSVGGCAQIVSALEALPNTVIPASSVYCSLSQGLTWNANMAALDTDGSTTANGVGSGTPTALSKHTYSLTFTGNPGYLKPIFIDTYLDGQRETVTPTTPGAKVTDTTVYGPVATTVNTYNDGISGEFTDYFAAKCEGVIVSVTGALATVTSPTTHGYASDTTSSLYSYEMNSGYYLDNIDDSAGEGALLKKCLGDSDGNDSFGNNVEVYDWDYGSYKIGGQGGYTTADPETYTYNLETVSSHPHAIKLVDTEAADDYVGGQYYLTWYQSTLNKFVLINPPSASSSAAALLDSYYVYTTDGVVERVIVDTVGKKQITKGQFVTDQPPVTAYFEQYTNVMYTSYDTACETAPGIVEPCLDKGDMLFVVDSSYLVASQNVSTASNTLALPSAVANSGDLYTISKIYKHPPTSTTFTLSGHEDRFRIVLDKNIPFAGTTTTSSTTSGEFGARTGVTNVGIVNLFKFSPATTGNYEFVSECSNRGSCVDGVCECYKGYTNDDCATQSAYAV
jgi:hypothetical protein